MKSYEEFHGERSLLVFRVVMPTVEVCRVMDKRMDAFPDRFITHIPLPLPMKGDLHTLKKVCQYGSGVMLAGTAIIGIIILGLLILAVGSLFSDAFSDILGSCIGMSVGSDPVGEVAGSYLELLSIFVLALVTVSMTHRVMVSVRDEHSPFTELNTSRMTMLSRMYIVGAVLLAVLELIGGRGPAGAAFMFFGCLLLAVVLFMFALMIRYGAVLQDESDHTL